MMIVMMMMMEEEDFHIKHFMWVHRGSSALPLIYMHLRPRKFLVFSYIFFPTHIISAPIRIFPPLYLCQGAYVVNRKISCFLVIVVILLIDMSGFMEKCRS